MEVLQCKENRTERGTDMRIYDCKVNHRINPLGYRMKRVSMSWKAAKAEGKRQEAARIRVYADPELTDCIYDTGWEEKFDSLGAVLPIELQPRTRYYWTVAVRTEKGEEAQSEVQWFETAKMAEEWDAKWISCDSAKKRHPYFEKEIKPEKAVKNARLYISGLGLYEAYYNGEKIGNEYLTPYSNDYKQWVQYQTFDLTGQLKEEGTFSVLLGNGWYKSRFGFTAVEDVGFYGNEWKLIAEIRICYEDGTEEVIGTDESWTVRRSKLTFSNLYDGEHRDDTLEELPLKKAVICEAPQGKLTERLSTPVTIHEQFSPIEVIRTPKDELVLDLGQEFAGIFRLRVKEPKGTVIHVQTGEILQNGCFYNENLRSAKSEYIYIADGTEQVIEPRFTYYGYRYVKLEGITDFQPEDFTGLAFYSEISEKGQLVTGNELVNRFVSNVRWGLKGNFVDVPTDCPQRDERMGWTGDAQVFSPTACYLADTYAFYEKYLYDMWQEQQMLDGKVPDVVPSCGVESTACVWGDAACIMPWNLYLFYGDQAILEDQFDSMKAWVDYVSSVDGENHGWRYVFHYGDWLALDNPNGGTDQVLGGTDEEFIANLYYAVSAELVAKAAAVLGRKEEEEKYRKLSQEQFEIVKKEYYSSTGRACIKTQTALILTLKYHLSENTELAKKMLRKLFEENNDKLKTGFVGTPLLCNVLSDNGFSELAYALLLNKEYPGWLHEVELGATTVWERWNSVLDDGSISSTGMNSLNHYSYGSVVEWMFSHAAGIRQPEHSFGFRKVTFAPELNWELRSIHASYDSPSGTYEIRWEMTDPKHVDLEVKIPFNAKASLILPDAVPETYDDPQNPMFAHTENGICLLEAGTYRVSYETNTYYKKQYSIDTPIQTLFANEEIKQWISKYIPYENIPAQYRGHSIREMNQEFGGRLPESLLKELDEGLRKIG